MHDKKVLDEDELRFPRGIKLYVDKGYEGYKAKYVDVIKPKKKPCKREMPEKDRMKNLEISRLRIKIEHAIGRVKTSRSTKYEFRKTDLESLDEVMFLAVCKSNFKLFFKRNLSNY